MRKYLIGCFGLICILFLLLYVLVPESVIRCLTYCLNIFWAIFYEILKFNALIASLVLLDVTNRLLKLLYAIYWAGQDFIEILPPRYESNGTLLAATSFLIQVTSFFMLYHLVKLWTFFTNPHDILFRILWHHRNPNFLEIFWFWMCQLWSYLKYLFIWIISGIPPRILRMLHIWHKSQNHYRTWVIYAPYLERLDAAASKRCLYYIQSQFQLNPYKKNSTLLWQSEFYFSKKKGADTYKHINKLNEQLDFIKKGDTKSLDKKYNINSIPEEAKEHVKSVHASQGPKHLFKDERDWHRNDNRAHKLNKHFSDQLGWADAKREEEMLLEFKRKHQDALNALKDQCPNFPDEADVGAAYHLSSKQRHPVIKNVGVLNYSNKQVDVNYVSTSSYAGVVETISSENPDVIQQIVLEPMKPLIVSGANSPVTLVCPDKNIFDPDVDNFRKFIPKPQFRKIVLTPEFAREFVGIHYIQNVRQEFDAEATNETNHAQLGFSNKIMQEYYEHLVDAYDNIDISNLKGNAPLSDKAVKAFLLLQNLEQDKDILTDNVDTQQSRDKDDSDNQNE